MVGAKLGPGEIFEIHMQNLFEEWEVGLEFGHFTEDDLRGFASTVGGWLWMEFGYWRDAQA